MNTSESYGKFVLVLHGHMPYVVSHGKWPHGTDWLSEATAETYLPLLQILRELEQENIHARITMGVSPILAEQLADPEFHHEFTTYAEMKVKSAEEDSRFYASSGDANMRRLADKWIEFYTSSLDDFTNRYNSNILSGFRYFLERGDLDLITCGATHGYFPLIGDDAYINLQVKTAVETHKKHFGALPKGIWMPECAYRPGYEWQRPVGKMADEKPFQRHGVEEFLIDNGIEYTFVDSHLLEGGKALGVYADRFEGLKLLMERSQEAYTIADKKDLSPHGLYKLASAKGSDTLTLFTRDPKTSLQVWSGEWGYPGDGNYLEFHKKHFPGGLKYWKITGSDCSLGEKQVYNPEDVEKRLEENASHFVGLIHTELEKSKNINNGSAGVLTSPFDAELFGHWWFEGVRFIKKVYEKLHHSHLVEAATAKEANDAVAVESVIRIPEGSWGEGGSHFIWLNEKTAWTWEEIYENEIAVKNIVEKANKIDSNKLNEIVTQLLRELMLQHASDWQFLISTIAAKDYAEMRIAHHHDAVVSLCAIAQKFMDTGTISPEDSFVFEDFKKQDHPFEHLDVNWLKALN